jgi:hypothetical protein
VYAAVFHKAGSVTFGDGLQLSADKEMFAMVQKESDKYSLYISDPNHSQTTAKLSLNINAVGQHAVYNSISNRTEITITYPLGIFRGKTFVTSVTKQLDPPMPNLIPVVSFRNPSANANFQSPANLMVEALASDPDGSIDNVRLYLNGDLVRQENLSPYTWNDPMQNDLVLTHLPAGAHQLRLVATDDSGDSSEVTQIITINSTPSSSSSEISSSSLSSSSGLLYSSSSESETPVTNLQIRHNSFSQENEISFDWRGVGPRYLVFMVRDLQGNIIQRWVDHSINNGKNQIIFNGNHTLKAGIYSLEVRENGLLLNVALFMKWQ